MQSEDSQGFRSTNCPLGLLPKALSHGEEEGSVSAEHVFATLTEIKVKRKDKKDGSH